MVNRCHGRSIQEAASEYDLPNTTVERWFYLYAADQSVEETVKQICVDEFAIRKGHNYASNVVNADTGRILAIVPLGSKSHYISIIK